MLVRIVMDNSTWMKKQSHINYDNGKNNSENKSNETSQSPFFQTFFHGTKADLKIGGFIEVGRNSNYAVLR